MPDEKPKFNPNQPYQESGNTITQDKPAFNPNKPFKEINGSVGLLNEVEVPKPTLDEIIAGIQTDNDNEKLMIKNLALKVNEGKAKHEDLTDAILTIQGEHSNQGGKKNYYVDNVDGVAIPKPLKANERPPKDVTDVFNETSWYEDLGNSLLRGSEKLGSALAKTPAFINDIAAIPLNVIADMTAVPLDPTGKLGLEPAFSSKKLAEGFNLPENKVAQYYDEQAKINQDNFIQKYDKGIYDYISKHEYKKAFGLLGNSIMESAPTTIGLAVANAGGVGVVQGILGGGAVFGAQKKGELDEQAPNIDEQAKMNVALSNGLFEGIFEQFGITKLGGITKQALLKDGKEEAYKLALDGFKETYRPVVTKYLGTSVEESLSEAATQFAQNTVDKFSGYKPDMNLSDGVADAAIVGFGAGAGYGLLGKKTAVEIQKQKVEKAAEQSKTIFKIVEQGNDAVVGFKSEIFNGVKNGKLTQEEADKAITKVNAYKDYNDMLGSLPVDEAEKRQLFDLSFQKQGLETEIGAVKDPSKLNPIEQAQYNVKEKIASDIQKQINEIVLKAQSKEETNLPKKTIEDVTKLENPKPKTEQKVPEHIKAIMNMHKPTKADSKIEYPKESRTYNEIPVEEFNSKKLHARNIHAKTVEFLEQQPNKQAIGTLTQLPFEYEGQKNETFGIKLPDGKIIKLASSMKRKEGFRGHFRTEHLIEDSQLEGYPLAIKVEEIPAIEKDSEPQKVIKAFNAVTGKFIAFTKATQTGKNNSFSPKQIEQLEHLGTVLETPIEGAIAPEVKPEQLQKQKISKGNIEVEHHENVLKVTKHIQSVLPKINVIYDAKLQAAGKLSGDGKTISVNPYYAGIDTPIHEGGHVIIDAMGYTNPTIQAAIKQLRETDLYKETVSRYSDKDGILELSPEMMDKEVLAEAIGREGVGIFDVEVKKNAFQKLLDKIFDWFKNKLGLYKNEAKALAKRLILGEFKNVGATNTGEEQYQKPKQDKINALESDLNAIEEQLDIEEDQDNINELESVRDIIIDKINVIKQEQQDFKKGIVKIEAVANAKDLKGFTLDQLIEIYNDAKNYDGWANKEMLDEAKRKIAYFLNQTGKERLEQKYGKQITSDANKKDLKWNEIWLSTLGHISQDFPELQEFYKVFNESFLKMQQDRIAKKSELEKLGKAVISEYNKKMGVGERALGLFTSNSAKYFEFLENGKGQFKSSAEANGLSNSQNDLLKFMRDLVKERQVQLDDETVSDAIIKIDKGFLENWKYGGLTDAVAQYMGGSNQDAIIEVGGEKTTYKDAQKVIIADSKKDLKGKALLLPKLLRLAYKAKRGAEKSNYGLNYNGQLTSKFDQPRDKDRGYSKDFYSAAMQFIDDQTHVQNMGKLVPLVDSIEQFYKYLGFEQNQSFGNVLKFIEQWKSEQIYQRAGETDPILDKTLQFFRRLTSMAVMGYNYTAGGINLAIGNYNSLRSEGATNWVKGQSRLFGGKDRAGYGTINKKAADILKQYDVVSQDFDSNPKAYAGKLFDLMAFGATRFGEYQIQGTLFLGQIDDKIWDSFEKNKDGDYVVKKTANEKEITQKMLQYKDRVSDIQGKYSSKDRYNISRFELGKSALQFKLWIGSWLSERYGGEYIDANNVRHRGSWNMFTQQAISELKNDWNKHNIAASWKNKQLRQNLSGAITVAALYVLTHADSDDEKKRKQTLSLDNALQQVLFVYDPQQAKYLLESPVASWGTMKKFIEALDFALHGEGEKAAKTAWKTVPYHKSVDDVNYLLDDKKK